MARPETIHDDVWERSGCELCLNNCGILVHRVNGKVVKIEGDPENPRNRGVICAKGNSGMFSLYSQTRVTSPLRRTNPEKGVGVDPQWVPISWEEALGEVAQRLQKIRRDDPRKLYVTTFMLWGADLYDAWGASFGTQTKPFSSGFYCGNNVHSLHLMTEAGFGAFPDTHYARYILLVGTQFGSVVNMATMCSATELSDKRPGKIKVVSVDPVGTYSASRAEEWVPIRPGTDAAFLLAIANVLVSEQKLYDRDFLATRTNAPYLIDPSGHYLRDTTTKKPLVWDAKKNSPVPFDVRIDGYTLEGSYDVGGQECKPAFQVLKDHLAKYDADWVSKVTTIPSDSIRRIAREFGETASIGEKISVKGVELPYRPASVYYYRGLSAHKHSFLAGMAANLVNTLIGAIEVPGGSVADLQVHAFTTTDGLLTTRPLEAGGKGPGVAYPPRKASPPQSIDFFELFPVAVYSRPFFIMGVLNPEIYRAPYQLSMIIQTRTNLVKTAVAPDLMERVLKTVPFIVSITTEIDETAEFADIIFPDVNYLERLSLPIHGSGQASGPRPWYWHGQRPLVDAPFETPWGRMVNSAEILIALAEKAGFIDDFHETLNHFWGLKEQYKLKKGEKYTLKEIYDRHLRNMWGDDKGLSWFMKKPLVVREKKPEEMYPVAFRKDRIHIYHEYMIEAGEDVKQVTHGLGLDFWDTSDYQPLPDWKACPAYDQKSDEFDLYLTNYKLPQQPMSYGQMNPLLERLTDNHRGNDILMNFETATKKGIQDGDAIRIQAISGKAIQGIAKVTQLIHPEVVACQGNGGRFARQFRKKTKGLNFNDFIAFDEQHLDFVSAAVDSCVRVKVSKLKS